MPVSGLGSVVQTYSELEPSGSKCVTCGLIYFLFNLSLLLYLMKLNYEGFFFKAELKMGSQKAM